MMVVGGKIKVGTETDEGNLKIATNWQFIKFENKTESMDQFSKHLWRPIFECLQGTQKL